MICALLVDPDESPDFPGGTAEVLGRALATFPLIAAKDSRHIGRHYAQCAGQTAARAAAQFGATSLVPPPPAEPPLSDEALIAHGYRQVVDDLKAEKAELELLVLLFSNTGSVSPALIDEGVEAMLADPTLDSAATASSYPRWTPRRAMREGGDGLLVPYAETMPAPGVPWFPDWGAAVVRPRVLEAMGTSPTPLAHLGKRIRPLKQMGGGPIDYHWQIPKLEYWLKRQGLRDNSRPEPQPQLQPAPKKDRRPTA